MRTHTVCMVAHRTKLRAPLRQKWLILIVENNVLGDSYPLWVNVAIRILCSPPAKLLCELLLLCFHKRCDCGHDSDGEKFRNSLLPFLRWDLDLN